MSASAATVSTPAGPLVGLRVVEFVGIGPGPHCGMLLADLGAEVLRFDRPGGNGWANAVMDRGRATVTVDLKRDADRELCRTACGRADVLVEGFRPGVMERLGLGPDVLLAVNPRLVYARITGWGQDGPRARSVGHDINYIGLAGALAGIRGADGHPVPPLNLVGDLGAGSMLAAFGILAALWERERSGRGQVIDAAIVDGVASLMSMFAGLGARGAASLEPGRSLLGGSAPFYRCYRCADGLEIAVGALEPQFYREFIVRSGAPESFLDSQYDTETWAERSTTLAELFATRTRDEWLSAYDGTDACVTPVLSWQESVHEPQLASRGTYLDREGGAHCAPVPRFSRTPGQARVSGGGGELLRRWGV